MMNDMTNPNNNFTIRVGRSFYDSLSMVGRVVGINVWNTSRTNTEMKRLTNCSRVLIGEGNMINKSTVWHRCSASLVEEYALEVVHKDQFQLRISELRDSEG